ncbi:hypothetical protein T484DRAFT_1824498 [Baffinella frigidus]|nr:hypothetical protein T484DRAFT_1824498 [Cryptophyta sp. CCMP2293]
MRGASATKSCSTLTAAAAAAAAAAVAAGLLKPRDAGTKAPLEDLDFFGSGKRLVLQSRPEGSTPSRRGSLPIVHAGGGDAASSAGTLPSLPDAGGKQGVPVGQAAAARSSSAHTRGTPAVTDTDGVPPQQHRDVDQRWGPRQRPPLAGRLSRPVSSRHPLGAGMPPRVASIHRAGETREKGARAGKVSPGPGGGAGTVWGGDAGEGRRPGGDTGGTQASGEGEAMEEEARALLIPALPPRNDAPPSRGGGGRDTREVDAWSSRGEDSRGLEGRGEDAVSEETASEAATETGTDVPRHGQGSQQAATASCTVVKRLVVGCGAPARGGQRPRVVLGAIADRDVASRMGPKLRAKIASGRRNSGAGGAGGCTPQGGEEGRTGGAECGGREEVTRPDTSGVARGSLGCTGLRYPAYDIYGAVHDGAVLRARRVLAVNRGMTFLWKFLKRNKFAALYSIGDDAPSIFFEIWYT